MCNTYLVYMTMIMITAVQPLPPCSEQHNPPCTVSFAVLLNPRKTLGQPRHTVAPWESGKSQRGRITSLAVPCLEAAFHPALRNPHVHSPISCYLFCFLLRGNSTRLVPEAEPNSPSLASQHFTLSCPMPRCPAAQVHRPGAAV